MQCFAINVTDTQLYEWNARTQVTLWGPETEGLHDYAYKLWSGLVGRFYLGRWQRWFAALQAAQRDQSLDVAAFQEQIIEWEEAWTRAQDAASCVHCVLRAGAHDSAAMHSLPRNRAPVLFCDSKAVGVWHTQVSDGTGGRCGGVGKGLAGAVAGVEDLAVFKCS